MEWLQGANQLFGGMCIILSSVHPPYKWYPLHSCRYIVRAIALLNYGHVPAQKIIWKQEARGWLSKDHNHVRKNSVAPVIF